MNRALGALTFATLLAPIWNPIESSDASSVAPEGAPLEDFHTSNCFDAPRFAVMTDIPMDPVNVPRPAIDDETRDRIFSVLEDEYREDMEKEGLQLEIVEADSRNFGGFASREGRRARVEILKGTRMHRRITPEAYTLIVCHEIGHHMGGPPHAADRPWGSVEGQADYHATLKCWRRVANELDFIGLADPFTDDDAAIMDLCEGAMPENLDDRLVCQSGLRASLKLNRLMAELRGIPAASIEVGSESPEMVEKTLETEPSPVCRWETFRRGALEMPRPDCWFKDSNVKRASFKGGKPCVTNCPSPPRSGS